MANKQNYRDCFLELVFPTSSSHLVIGKAGTGMTRSHITPVEFPSHIQTPSQQQQYIEMLQRQGYIFFFDQKRL